MDKILEAVEQFKKAVLEAYPMFTDANIHVDSAGWISVNVVKWGDHSQRAIEDTPRVFLLKCDLDDGKWGADQSMVLNAHLKMNGLLEEAGA